MNIARCGFAFAAALLIAGCGRDAPPASESESTAPASSPVAATATPRLPDGLEHTLWRLDDARDGSGQRIGVLLRKPGLPYSLSFDGGRLSLRNGCNHLGAHYRYGADFQFHIDTLTGTEKACLDAAVVDAEARMVALLQGAVSARHRLEKPARLEITSAGGEVLSFEPIPLPSR